MTLAHWFACSELNLSARASTNFLDVVTCLDDPHCDPELVSCALDTLGSSDLRLQALAIPNLVAFLMRPPEDELRYRTAALILEVTGPMLAPSELASVGELTVTALIEVVSGLTPPQPSRALTRFADLVESAPHLLGLSLLREALRLEDEALAVELEDDDDATESTTGAADHLLRGDEELWYLAHARRNSLGRAPLLVATECLALGGESPSTLVESLGMHSSGAWLGEPDLVQTRLSLELAFIGVHQRAGRAVWLCEEAVTLRLYSGQPGASDPTGIGWLGLATQEQGAAAQVSLWQAVCWEQAALADAAVAAQALAVPWAAPDVSPSGIEYLNFPGRLDALWDPLSYFAAVRPQHNDQRGSTKIRLRGEVGRPNRPSAVTFAFSPWLDRSTSAHHPAGKQDKDLSGAPKTYPAMDNDAAMLRLAANARTLTLLSEALLRAGKPVPDHLWDLFLNMLDALHNVRLRETFWAMSRGDTVPSGQRRLRPAVLILLLAAREHLERAGKGQLHPDIPSSLMSRIRDQVETTSGHRVRQLSWLYKQAGLMAVAHLVWESLSGELTSTTAETSPWMRGGPQSPAAQLLHLLFGPVWAGLPYPEVSIQEPAVLSAEIFPRLMESKGGWDWRQVYRESRKRIGLRLLILSDPTPIDIWQTLEPLDESRFNGGAWFAALNQRLLALVESGHLTDDHPWFTAWVDYIEQINGPKFLAREVREELLRFLRRTASSAVEYRVQQLALRAVLEFGAQTIRYQDRAGVALAHTWSRRNDAKGDAVELGSEWLHVMSRPTRDALVEGRGPWARFAAYRTAEQRQRSVWGYLSTLQHFEGLPPWFAEVLQRIDKSGATPLAAMEADRGGSARTTLAFQRRGGVDWVARVPGTPLDGNESQSHSVDAGLPHGRLGVIAGRAGEGEHAAVTINVGESELVTGPRLAWRVGDPVVVERGEIRPFPAPAGHPGDVVYANVAWHDGVLTVQPRDRSHWEASSRDRDVISRWLPDTLTAVEGPLTAECHAERRSDGTWIPAARDLTRLIVDRFGQDSEQSLVVVTEASGGHEWELSGEFGSHYRVPEDAMTPTLVEAFDHARIIDRQTVRSLAGLRVRVRLILGGERPLLDIVPGPSVDDENLRWRDQFRDHKVEVAVQADGVWSIAGEEGRRPVAVYFGASGEPPLTDQQARVRLHVNGWDSLAQRQGRARVTHLPYESLPVVRWDDRAALRDHLDARIGSVFRLAELTGGSMDGYFEAITTSGLPVWVAADSLSFLPGVPGTNLVAGREVHVQRFTHRPKAGVVDPTPMPLDSASLDATRLSGLVARRTPGVAEVSVWLDLGDRAQLVPVPTSSFSSEVGKIGDRVVAARTGDRWAFSCVQVDLMARAGWTIENGAAPIGSVALSVTTVPDHGPALILQSPDEPVLFLADPDDSPGKELTCGLPRGGHLRQARRRFAKDTFGRDLDIVLLSIGGDSVMGHSKPDDFRTPSPWLTASLVLERHSTAGPDWVDAHREFTPGRSPRRISSRDHTVAQHSVAHTAEWPTGYKEWLAEANEHTMATVVPGKPSSVRLRELRVPADPRAPGSHHLETVPFLRGEHTSHLRGHGYDQTRVKVRLTYGSQGWTASYRTDPLSLAEFERTVLAQHGVQHQKFRIWYAGLTPEGRHRFEWGYGWTLELDDDEFETRSQLPFFFNDCLSDLSVIRKRNQDNTYRLVLRVGYLRWEVDRMVREDAEMGMLHQVQVRLRTSANGRARVQVEGVHTRTRPVPDATAGINPTIYSRMFHAEFDRESELLINRLADPNRPDQAITVLARLDRTRTPGLDGVARSRFTLLSTDPQLGDEARLPREGESLVLVAASIRRTGTSHLVANDYELPFELPLGHQGGGPSLEVRVLRRQFSIRESALRQAARANNADAYRGVPMLVKLVRRDARGTWQGSVIDAPARPWHNLRQWLRSDPDQAYVTVGTRLAADGRAPAVLVEQRPGVIGRFELSQQDVPPRGSLCRIDQLGDAFRLVPLVQGARRYVPERGRPVLLLLKDDVLRQRNTNGRGGFTVAGLPGIQIEDNNEARRALFRPPPRLGAIRRQAHGFELIKLFVKAGRLRTVDNCPDVLAFGRPELPTLDWPQLSFRDGTPDALAEHTRRGGWRYHDEMTGFVKDGRLQTVTFPDPVRSKDGPLFFDEQWRLRYEQSELPRFGFNAAEVLEYGLPKEHDWYPVAAPSRAGGIWVELSPGRVVELSGALMRSGATKANRLDGLPWGVFAPGDEVLLDTRRDAKSGAASVILMAWRPGPRGWFGQARALLVPSTDMQGRRTLGIGSTALFWSGTDTVADEPRWLSPDNTVLPFDSDVSVGDVVALHESADHELQIHGAAHLPVRLTADWGPHAWLRQALETPSSRMRVLAALGGALATTIASVGPDGVAVRPAMSDPTGNVLAVTVLGPLDADRVLVRSGSSLLPLPTADLLPAVPEHARSTVVERLVTLAQLTWLKRQDGRWVSPALSKTKNQAFRAQAVAAVPGGLVLVRDIDLALEWLPLTELGPIADDTADAVLDFVRKSGGTLDLVETSPGAASFLKTHEGRRVRQRLTSGDVPLAIPQALVSTGSGPTWTYLASMFPTMALLPLRSETELVIGEPITIDIENPSIDPTAIPRGQGRTRLLLAPWLLAALRKARVGGAIDTGIIAEQAHLHRSAYIAATDRTAGPLGERLVATLRQRVTTPSQPSSMDLRSLVGEWLSGQGRDLLTGRNPDSADSAAADWHLPPLLAAALLLAELGTESAAASALSVHASSRIGQLATGALHQEVLLRDWLLRERSESRQGRWARLDRLDLGGRTLPSPDGEQQVDPYVRAGALSDSQFDGLLTRSQLTELRNACEGVLGAWSEPDEKLRRTARSLLFATGDFSQMDDILDDLGATQLARVAALGRALGPGTDALTAQPRLTPWQIQELRRRFDACLTHGIPLTLLPENAPEVPVRLAEWAASTTDGLLEEMAQMPEERP